MGKFLSPFKNFAMKCDKNSLLSRGKKKFKMLFDIAGARCACNTSTG